VEGNKIVISFGNHLEKIDNIEGIKNIPAREVNGMRILSNLQLFKIKNGVTGLGQSVSKLNETRITFRV
jgi:hypothetical protein